MNCITATRPLPISFQDTTNGNIHDDVARTPTTKKLSSFLTFHPIPNPMFLGENYDHEDCAREMKASKSFCALDYLNRQTQKRKELLLDDAGSLRRSMVEFRRQVKSKTFIPDIDSDSDEEDLE